MLTVATLLLLAAPTAGETVLLDFYSDSCGPCRMMEPTVARLQQQGYAVQKINVSQYPDYARQFGVDGVPCFVMLAEGREIDRVVGYTSYDRLAQMLDQGKRITAQAQTAAAPSSLPGGTRPTSFGAAREAYSPNEQPSDRWTHNSEVAAASFERPGEFDPGRLKSPEQRSLAATVRLKIEDADGHSFGTGTIVHQHGGEALVLTCGHVFRDSQGKGRITVDLFVEGGNRTVAGELISYDLQLDVGLVSIKPGVAVSAVELAVASYRPAIDEAVFTVGCDHGRAPTVIASRVAAVNKYVGPENVVVKGAPVDGRSGGGLFSADGKLIGVCNAADPADDEGLYAAIASVFQHLQKERLAQIFEKRGAADIAFAGPASKGSEVFRGQSETEERVSQASFAQPTGGSRESLRQVECILRTDDGREERIVIQAPSQELLMHIRGAHGSAAGSRNASSAASDRNWDDVVIPLQAP